MPSPWASSPSFLSCCESSCTRSPVYFLSFTHSRFLLCTIRSSVPQGPSATSSTPYLSIPLPKHRRLPSIAVLHVRPLRSCVHSPPLISLSSTIAPHGGDGEAYKGGASRVDNTAVHEHHDPHLNNCCDHMARLSGCRPSSQHSRRRRASASPVTRPEREPSPASSACGPLNAASGSASFRSRRRCEESTGRPLWAIGQLPSNALPRML